MIKRAFLIPLAAALAACAGAPQTALEKSDSVAPPAISADGSPGLEVFAAADERLAAMTARIYARPESVPYDVFWSAYLDSSKIQTAVEDREGFLIAWRSFSADDCRDFDWEKWTWGNFFELEPHLVAQECYRHWGDMEKAERQGRALEYILSGVLGGGDGKSMDTAYEIGILDHALGIVSLSGYQPMDSYLQPLANGDGLFYIVQAEDPQSGDQRNIYFHNQRALHRILGVDFPFAGIDNLYISRLLEPFSKTSSAAAIGMGRYHEMNGRPEEAAPHYIKAAAHDSQIAQHYLGRLCLLNRELPVFPGKLRGFLPVCRRAGRRGIHARPRLPLR